MGCSGAASPEEAWFATHGFSASRRGCDMIDYGSGNNMHWAPVGLMTSAGAPHSVHFWAVWDGPGSTTQPGIFFSTEAALASYYYTGALEGPLRFFSSPNPPNVPAETTGAVGGTLYSIVSREELGGDYDISKDGTYGPQQTGVVVGTCVLTSFGAVITAATPTAISYFQGSVGPLTIWDKSLTQKETDSLAAGANPLTIARSTIANHYPMRGSGPVSSRTRDVVGGAHLDSVVGAPVASSEPPRVRCGWAHG